MKKISLILLLSFLVIFQNSITASAYVYTEEIEDDTLDYNKIQWEESDDTAEVVLYLYPGTSEYEGATITDHTVTYCFDGVESFYCENLYNNFMEQAAFQKYGVITKRMTLPKNEEYWVHVSITGYPIRTTPTYVADKNGKIMDGTVIFTEDYYELFLVCGSEEWLKASGDAKLEEIRQLFCTDAKTKQSNASIELMGQSTLESYIEANGTELANRFSQNDELDVIVGTIGEGNYNFEITRQDVRKCGYDVPLSKTEAEKEMNVEEEAPIIAVPERDPVKESISFLKKIKVWAPFLILCIVFFLWKRNKNRK